MEIDRLIIETRVYYCTCRHDVFASGLLITVACPIEYVRSVILIYVS